MLMRKHPIIVTAARNQGAGSRKCKAARGRLAECGMFYPTVENNITS